MSHDDGGGGMNVLIVEDNPANLMLAGAVLRRAGHRITEARSAEEALERLRVATPDLILMDVQLPGLDGLALTRQLKGAPGTVEVVVVALTAHAMREDRARAIEAGCDGYIAKPINTRTLADELGAIVRTSRTASAGV
jgi:two-component system cell cycle response regulator DivK